MLREQVLQAWNNCKEKIDDLNYELFTYQGCFIITDGRIRPKKHNQSRMLTGLYDIPDRILTNSEAVQTGFNQEVNKELTYHLAGKELSASTMVVLLWGATIEIED